MDMAKTERLKGFRGEKMRKEFIAQWTDVLFELLK